MAEGVIMHCRKECSNGGHYLATVLPVYDIGNYLFCLGYFYRYEDIMLKCWEHKGCNRPTFGKLVPPLQAAVDRLCPDKCLIPQVESSDKQQATPKATVC